MNPKDNDQTDYQDETLQNGSVMAPGEIIIGSLVDIDSQGQPLVDYPESPVTQPLVAMSTLGLNKQHIGRQVALLFANGNAQNPVIMGLIHSPLHDLITTYELSPSENHEHEKDQAQAIEPETDSDDNASKQERPDTDLSVNNKRHVIEAEEEIVLKCGEASITLTKAGKILIRGKYVLTRSEGVNRIMGGSVQVN